MTYTYKAIVKKVIDGDTIDLDIDCGFDIWTRQRVRLYGIDTPETRTKDIDEKIKGNRAKEFVKNILPEGQEILITSESKGKYGRYLVTIFIEKKGRKINLNKLLVAKKLARVYFGEKKEKWK